jgi:hypothetical protein
VISKESRARLKSAKFIKLGGRLKDSHAALCIYKPRIDLAMLTSVLRCQPTYAHEKGQLSKSRLPHRCGLWSLDAPKRYELPRQLQFLLDSTTSNLQVWRKLSKNHKIMVRCGLFLQGYSEDVSLTPDLLAQVAARRWLLLLDAYSAEGDEIVSAFFKRPRGGQPPKGGPTTA